MSIGVFLVLVAVLLIIGVPVCYSMAASSIVFMVLNDIPGAMVMQKIFSSVDKSALLCIPFFILAGDLMNRGGIGSRIILLCRLLVGNIRGSMCYVVIIACTFFGAITGSSIACCVALGAILIPELVSEGYSREFSTAITAAGSTLGQIIPPSVALVTYASITDCSVTSLYKAGLPAGIIIAIFFMGMVFFKTRKSKMNITGAALPRWKDLEPEEKKARKKEILKSLWALGMPIVILGGIFSGFCTPTEASVIAVAYALFVGVVVYRELPIKDLPKIFVNSCWGSARIMFIMGCAGLFAWVITYENLPQTLMGALTGISSSKYLLLAVMIVIALFMGMFIEGAAILLITVPVYFPMMSVYEIDPIHAGVFLVCLNCVGLLTPPFGTVLYTGSHVGKISVHRLAKSLMPFILVETAAVILITLIPELIMWII